MIAVQCPNCGSQFNTDDASAGRAAKCPNCGSGIQVPYPQAPQAPMPVQQVPATIVVQAAPAAVAPAYPQVPGHGGMAVGGMICGIVALALSFIPFCFWIIALLLGITGIILSAIALATAGKARRKKGVAVAGLICSGLAIIWIPLYIFVFIGAMSSAFSVL